jgi:bifunctional DNA-binding transcriptional regulator/antitoxin component of YhaV-PrlF toxin-antitoxin module
MSDTTTLFAKFQISIPKSVRVRQRWDAGQRLVFIPKGTGVLMVPVPDRTALTGLAKGASNLDHRDRSERV